MFGPKVTKSRLQIEVCVCAYICLREYDNIRIAIARMYAEK